MTIPGTLRAGGWAGFAGKVSFYRRFGRPSNLGTNDRVRLAFAGVTGSAEVRLNGERLGELNGKREFDVTDRMRKRNELEVVMNVVVDGCGITGEVAIEIIAG
jgi:hypothetical protein